MRYGAGPRRPERQAWLATRPALEAIRAEAGRLAEEAAVRAVGLGAGPEEAGKPAR